MFLSLQLLGAHLSILQEALTHRKIEARSEEVPGSSVWSQFNLGDPQLRVGEVLSVNQIPLLLLHIPFFSLRC